MMQRVRILAAVMAVVVAADVGVLVSRGLGYGAAAPAASGGGADEARTMTAARVARPQEDAEPARTPRRIGRELIAVTTEETGPIRIERPEPRAGSEVAPRRKRGTLSEKFPAQYAARQVDGDPATFHWALLIGITDYASPAPDTYTGRQDQVALRKHLLAQGWRADHIMLLKDRHASAKSIITAVRWLAARTDPRSTVVFSYAGHEKPLRTGADGDSEPRDVAIWAADNRLVVDGDLGRELGRVRAKKMWIHFATCRAAGFDDRGMIKPGRVITYSSRESEYSYEDPSRGHSVIGYYLVKRGMIERRADRNGDGRVTVEEAFTYARPRAQDRTGDLQHPSIVDRYDGAFSLRVPPKPKPRRDAPDDPTPTPTPCVVLCP